MHKHEGDPMADLPPLLAGIELGGTKAVAVLARGTAIVDRVQLATTGAEPTLAALSDWLSAAEQRHGRFAALGIASFGPLCLAETDPQHGRITATPKPGWSDVDVLHRFRQRFARPTSLDTDVNGAALAEGLWGAAQGADVHAYLTIGTGVGLGLVVGGRAVHGAMHSEFGHIRLRRRSGDMFRGACPWHGDCLEGLIAGGAIAARADADPRALAPDHPVWAAVVDDLAEALSILILTVSPQRIVVGGGIGLGQPQIVEALPQAVGFRLAGYLTQGDASLRTGLITPAGLGADAGPLGAIALARNAFPAC